LVAPGVERPLFAQAEEQQWSQSGQSAQALAAMDFADQPSLGAHDLDGFKDLKIAAQDLLMPISGHFKKKLQ
jgi:hypothetical protein